MSRLIEKERHRFGVEPTCRALEVAVSSYYYARRVWKQLRREGVLLGRCRRSG